MTIITCPSKNNCHSPTQPQLELELDLIMGRKPPTHQPTPLTTPLGTFKAQLIFGMQPYFDRTRKMISKKMEDNLKKNKM
jgi:hypothetical protein